MSAKFQRLDPKTSSGWLQWDDCTEYVQALERLAKAVKDGHAAKTPEEFSTAWEERMKAMETLKETET